MRQKRISVIVMLAVFGIGLVVGGFSGAAATNKPKWSISLTGGIDGIAEAIKPTCVYSPDGESTLIAQATFEVSGARFRISIHFAPPVQPGSREFASIAGPGTVVVGIAEVSDPSTSWVSSADGTGTVNANRRSGSVKGTLAALGADGIETGVDASFECSKLSTGRSGSTSRSGSTDRSGSERESDELWVGPIGSTFSDAYPCSGSDEGTIAVRVRGKKATGTAAVSGSFTCDLEIGSYSASGSVTFGVTGTFTDHKFRFSPEPVGEIVGDGPTSNCAAIPERPIDVPVTEQGTAKASFEWSLPGVQYTCEITLTRQ